MKYYDISPLLSEKSAVFPGDTAFKRKVAMDYKTGHHITLSSIETTLHIGAHADAPSHYHADGDSIEKRNIEVYFGRCQIVDAKAPLGERVQLKHFSGLDIQASRVLIKTNSIRDNDQWTDDFNSLSVELVEHFYSKGVRLIGLDTPSIDPEDSKDLPSHKSIFKHDMSILEGLNLKDVPEGLYFLSALPLKIKNADSSPVRAVLWDLDFLKTQLV